MGLWRAVAALATVFLVKVVVLVQLRNHPLLQADAGLDTTVYLDLARRVIDGNVALGPGLYFVRVQFGRRAGVHKMVRL